MRAATRIRIGSGVILLVALALLVVVAGGFLELRSTVETNDRIARSLNGMFELSMLTTDFVINLEPRAERQWRQKYAALEGDLESVLAEESDPRRAEELLGNYRRVGEMFDRLVEARDEAAAGVVDEAVSQEYRERLAAQMLIEMQQAVTKLVALGDETSQRVLATMLGILVASSVVAGVGIVAVFGNAVATERDVVRRLVDLRTAAVRLGSGDLSYRTGIESGSDEVAELAHAFDEMADEIERAHVMLSQEIGQRKEAETELVAYRDDLERLVEERTIELEHANLGLQAATEAKDRFLAAMSHELRTPLNSIIGFTDIMLRGMAGELTEEQAKQLAMVNASGKHLLVLINDMLDLSRIEAGADRVELEPVDPVALVRGCVDTVRPMALEKRLALDVHDGDGVPERIETDPAKVKQILLNLLSNAVKFTDTGTITVRIDVRDDEWIEIQVEDTGIGIPASAHEQIFDSFYQGPDPRLAKSPGTGLGLAISRRLAEMLGGTLTAGANPAGGAVFTLVLPVG